MQAVKIGIELTAAQMEIRRLESMIAELQIAAQSCERASVVGQESGSTKNEEHLNGNGRSVQKLTHRRCYRSIV